MSSSPSSIDAAAIRRIMADEGASVAQNTRGFNQGRYASVARLPNYEALKKQARTIKEDAIDRLPALIDQLRAAVEARGGTVYLAEDAADANRHIVQLTKGAQRLVKSKSMTSEEIEVNEALEQQGIDVVETDLGEWVLQLADEAPSHIVAPAIHKSREAIAELFRHTFAPEEPLETAEALTRFARQKLGALIEGADVGMTGANFIAADTGTMVLVTSEGNARKTALVPPTYIAVAGVEKIVPTLQDVQPFVELIGRSGTGQDITSYISFFTPPFAAPVPAFTARSNGQVVEDRTFHLVLIDNGRMAMRDDPDLQETLYCIRCSACANTCANFQEVGGHAFGGKTYSGGIATGWEAGLHGLDTADSFNDLCTGCTRCVPACPVGIDIPWINTVVQDRINRSADTNFDWLVEGLVPDEEPGGLSLSRRVFGHFAFLAHVGSRLAPLSNWLARPSLVRAIMEHVLGIDRRRALPTFQRTTLRRWMRRRTAVSGAVGTVVLYADPYTNYVRPGRGRAAVRALEALGYRVYCSEATPSGRAPLSQGMVRMARSKAEATYDALAPHLDAGHPVIVLEPSDLAMFHRDYDRLLSGTASERLQAASVEVLAFIQQHLDRDDTAMERLQQGAGHSVAYHSHCQQRTLGQETPTLDVLRRCGYEVTTSSVECCGMAGSFGYKADYYELSMQVGARLREQLADAVDDGAQLAASGVSCIEQLETLFDRTVVHPIELIAPGIS